MNFALSEEQDLFKKTAREFFQNECPKSLVRELEASDVGYSPSMWQKMARMDWLGLPIPKTYGGLHGTLLDLGLLFEEIGRAACPVPLFSTVVLGALPILDAATEEQKQKLLPAVVRGQMLLTMAHAEPNADNNPSSVATIATAVGGNFSIDGCKLFVPDAHIADYLLTSARSGLTADDGLSLLIVDRRSEGLSLTPLLTISRDKQHEVKYQSVGASVNDLLGARNSAWPIIERTKQRAAAIRCAELVGVAERALEMTAQYAPTRVQFGRPIASFQAVQCRVADMLVDVEGARWTTYQALWALENEPSATREVAIAQTWTSEAAQRVVLEAHRIHGGLGIDVDYDLHFYYRRAKTLQLNLGPSPFGKREIQATIGL